MNNDLAMQAAIKLNQIADECADVLLRRWLAELTEEEREALLAGEPPVEARAHDLPSFLLARFWAKNERAKTA